METDDWIINNIQGAKAFIDWFGTWPTFHDAEVVELHLSRSESSWIKIHTWKITEEANAVFLDELKLQVLASSLHPEHQRIEVLFPKTN